jgi:hypothetical protein
MLQPASQPPTQPNHTGRSECIAPIHTHYLYHNNFLKLNQQNLLYRITQSLVIFFRFQLVVLVPQVASGGPKFTRVSIKVGTPRGGSVVYVVVYSKSRYVVIS